MKEELPVSDRDFNRLAVLTVGVNYSTPSGPRDSVSGAFAANGVSQYQNNYVLDGTDNNSYDQNVNEGRTFAIEPSMDAISEFKVETNSYSAEFGRDGGAVINVLTKSGTNKLHGSAYKYFQDSDLNSNDYFNNALGNPKTDYTKNIYGASLGGPVWLPKLYNGRDKTFFFADFEQQPYRSPGSVNTGLLPTQAEVSGNFQGSPTIYDPTTNQPFPNNTIPANRIDPVAAKIAAAIPQASGSTTASSNYSHESPVDDDDNRAAVRIDHQLSQQEGDHFFGRTRKIGAHLGGVHDPTPVITGESAGLYPCVRIVAKPIGAKEENATDGRHKQGQSISGKIRVRFLAFKISSTYASQTLLSDAARRNC